MHHRIAIAFAASLAVATPLRAQDPQEPPKAPAPRVVAVISVTEEAILYRDHIFNGPALGPNLGEKPPAGTQRVTTPDYRPGIAVAVRFPLKDGAVYDVGGKRVAAADVRKRVKAGDVVAVSTDYKPVDPVYLKAF